MYRIAASRIALLVSLLLLCLLLAGCRGTESAINADPTSLPTARLTQAPAPAPTHSGADAGATKIAIVATENAALGTAGANYTPVESLTPETLPTSIPALTPILGFPDECGDASKVFNYGGCYTAQINNEYIFVQIGGPRADPLQGLLRVYTSTLDQRTRSPWQEYPTPRLEGLIYSAQFANEHLLVIAPHNNAPTTEFSFNLLTRTWEDPGACRLYPIVVHTSSVQGLLAPYSIINASNGGNAGNFGWLNWPGDATNRTLDRSLTPPGDSITYINPDNPADRRVSIGDWIVGHPGVNNEDAVAGALSKLATSYFRVVVPVWDQSTGHGDSLRYHAAGFVWIQLVKHNLTNPNQISIRYWGPATCPDSP